MTDGDEPHPHATVDSGEVAVPTKKLAEIRRLIMGAVLGGVVVAGAFVWFAGNQASTNDHLGRTDEALAAFITAELAEEEREQAAACVDVHERYAEFEDLAAGLTRAGATTAAEAYVRLSDAPPEVLAEAEAEIDALLPGEIAPLLERYPAPSCDLEAAATLLATPAPAPPSVEELLAAP